MIEHDDDASNQRPVAPGRKPAAPTGSGSIDPVTSSEDPAVLRDLLIQAWERLSFYESFDRIIGENVKRSGELMLEALNVREQADANARELASAKADFEHRLHADKQRHRHLLTVLSAELDDLHGRITSFHAKIQATLVAIDDHPLAASGSSAPSEPPVPPDTFAPPESPAATVRPLDVADMPESFVPNTIDALFHGIPDPGTALELQRYVKGIQSVQEVEAREFAEGILRLRIVASRSLGEPDFAAWPGKRKIRISRARPDVIEAALAPPGR
jgi:hypothetical protein